MRAAASRLTVDKLLLHRRLLVEDTRYPKLVLGYSLEHPTGVWHNVLVGASTISQKYERPCHHGRQQDLNFHICLITLPNEP
jgi:hypothetical protein